MSLPHGLDLKKTVHGIKRQTLGLRDKEKHESSREDHKRRKEEVNAVAHANKHLGRKAGNNKIPEPVVRCGGSLTKRSA
jgi:hypothetical protein